MADSTNNAAAAAAAGNTIKPPPAESHLLKACLIAPTFIPNPSPPSDPNDGDGDALFQNPYAKTYSRSAAARAVAAAAAENKSMCFGIDSAVKKAYGRARAERDVARKELVRGVLGEGRDGVVDAILEGKKKRRRQQQRQLQQRERKRKNVCTDIEVVGPPSSPSLACRNKSKRGRLEYIAEEEKKNDDSENDDDDDASDDNNNDEENESGSSTSSGGSVVVEETTTTPKTTTSDGGKFVTDSDADNSNCDETIMKMPRGTRLATTTKPSSSSSSQSTNHHRAASSSSSMQQQRKEQQQQQQTLVFPRLPSNNSPGYQVFAPLLLCQPCMEDDSEKSGASRGSNKSSCKYKSKSNGKLPTAMPPNLSKPLTSTNNNTTNQNNLYETYTLTIKSKNKRQKQNPNSMTTTHQPLLLEGTHAARPKSSSLIFLKSALVCEDEPSLSHVPYFGDGDNEDIYGELFDTTERERLYEFGPKYAEIETLESVDGVLLKLSAGNGVSGSAKEWKRLFEDEELLEEAVTMAAEKKKATEELERSGAAAVMATNDKQLQATDNTANNDAASEEKKKGTKKSPTKQQQKRLENVQKLVQIHFALSRLAECDLERVHERHALLFLQKKNDVTAAAAAASDKSGKVSTKEESSDTMTSNDATKSASISSSPKKKNSETCVPVGYETIMDSYRDLFCRRCFTYDCNIHGNLPKASLGLLGELAVRKERVDGHWKELDKDITLADTTKNDTANGGINDSSQNVHAKNSNANHASQINGKAKGYSNISTSNGKSKADCKDEQLTPAQQSICKRAFLIFQGNTAQIAHAIHANPSTVDAYIKSNNIQLPQQNKYLTTQLLNNNKRKGKRGSTVYASMKNYNQKWLRHIQSKVIHPAFLPCDHCEPCNEETCSCVQNGFFCTKHCGWGSKSPNFFRGCECKAGQCQMNSCPCYAANRECDPDLCRTCGACCDPSDAPATGEGQRCRNDNISMYRHAHLLIAESSIKQAGWGLFTKHTLKKGDFVHEYVGEVISQEEAERRGVIYDKLNMSYLFNLSSDLVVDATRKGNKARYANHSSTPNIEPKMIHVNGDMRIGFFAKHDIDAQSELFFDYRYDDQMDNDLIFKPDHSVNFDWMNKNNTQGKKKNA